MPSYLISLENRIISLTLFLAECLKIVQCITQTALRNKKLNYMQSQPHDQHMLKGVRVQSVSVTDEGLSIRIKDIKPSVPLPRIVFISWFHSSALFLLLDWLVAMTKPTFSTLTFCFCSFNRFQSPKLWLTSHDSDRRVQVTASHTGC